MIAGQAASSARLARLDAATGQEPDQAPVGRVTGGEQQDALGRVDEQYTRRATQDGLRCSAAVAHGASASSPSCAAYRSSKATPAGSGLLARASACLGNLMRSTQAADSG